MRPTAIAFAALLLAGSLLAQTDAQPEPAQKPDYSRPNLIRILHAEDTPPEAPRRIEFPFGAIQIRGFGTRWLIGYLPFLMPLSGSVNNGRGLGSNFPNPFALTGTEIPYTARSWHDQRAMSRELRRIESEERKRAKVKVNPE
jgi:hypothetical protein